MLPVFRYGHLGYWVCALVVSMVVAAFYVVNDEMKRSSARVEQTLAELQHLSELAPSSEVPPPEIAARLIAKRNELRKALDAELRQSKRVHRLTERGEIVLAGAGAIIVLVLLPLYVAFARETRARAEAEALLRDVTESLPGAAFRLRVLPAGGMRFEYVTENVQSVRGVSRDALLTDARSIHRNVHVEDVPAVMRQLEEAAQRVEPVDFRFRIVDDEDGRVRWIQVSARPRREPDGSILWHGRWIDITEVRALEEALVHAKDRAEQMNRAKSLFLAAMSHEIRTPMTGVIGMLELVALGPLADEQRSAIAVVRESSEALLRIIEDILDFSRMEAGKLELRPEPASLGRIVGGVADLYAAVAAKKGVDLVRRIDPALREAYLVDAVRLQQIVSNLTSNALKFTDRGTVEVAVDVELRGQHSDIVRVSVRDTGRGIDPADRARLFKPFAQAAGSDHGGTGLGLSISHGLAQLMGGSLALESEPGRGTVATLVLPLEPARARAHRPGAPAAVRRFPAPAVRAGAPRVLIVDDHPINRLVLDRQVTMLGYVAETAASAEEALERSSAGGFAAMLADVNMPGIDGYTLARLMRERERRERAPRMVIVACTANALRGEDTKCLDAGMDGYLAKPVTLAQLDAMLRRWLPLPHAPLESHA